MSSGVENYFDRGEDTVLDTWAFVVKYWDYSVSSSIDYLSGHTYVFEVKNACTVESLAPTLVLTNWDIADES